MARNAAGTVVKLGMLMSSDDGRAAAAALAATSNDDEETQLTFLLIQVTIGEPIYPSMQNNSNQTIAMISDTGAYRYKPLFIAGSTVMVVLLDLGMIAERWLRHTGDLLENTSWWQKALSIIAIIASIAGAAGIILLSCFDTYRHPKLHDRFLILFLAGYVISAIFICAEYQRLGVKYRRHPVLAASFWVKLAFILIEIALAIRKLACLLFCKHKN
jgi:hypothetical protein